MACNTNIIKTNSMNEKIDTYIRRAAEHLYEYHLDFKTRDIISSFFL